MSQPSAADRVVAHDELRQLVARYAVAMDARDLDVLVALFVDDVRVGSQTGRAALRAFFEASLADVSVSILTVGTHLIELDDADHGRGVVYCRAELQIGDRWIVQAIQYRDTYERRAGTWAFVRRQHLLWYGRDVGTSPVGLPPANWPEQATGWGDADERWTSWREHRR